ncbi:unnamed protein product, partial [Thelazia callipaeda]|uniref:Pecanex-like protein n=1 Tax=Thelazia callipaeda TaxID=103827 RepID=A0A0N5CTA7_THECL
MRNGTTISVPLTSLSTGDIGENHSPTQKEVKKEPEQNLIEENIARPSASSTPLEVCVHGNIHLNTSTDSDSGRDLLTFEVPHYTSTPSSSMISARETVTPNHYSLAPEDMKVKSELPLILNEVLPASQALSPLLAPSDVSNSSTSIEDKTTNYVLSSNDHINAVKYFRDLDGELNAVKSLRRHISVEPSSTKDKILSVSGVLETTFPISASVSLDPIPSHLLTDEIKSRGVPLGKEKMFGGEEKAD